MPSMWRCSCGKLLKAKDGFSGRQAPCPACNAVHTIPKGEKPPEPPEEIFDAELVEEPEDQILDALPVYESARQMPAGYAMEPENSDGEPERRDTSERGRPPLRRPRLSKRRRRRRPITIDDSGDSEWWSLKEGWYGNVHGGVLGGVLMLAIAFVLFIVGLAINRIFYLTIILGVIGVAAIITGLIHKR